MKKIALSLDSLQVESFDTTSGHDALRGTVQGASGDTTLPCQAGTYEGGTCDSTCNQIACGCTAGGPHQGTCDYSCGGTCFGEGGDTCAFTCNGINCPSTPDYGCV